MGTLEGTRKQPRQVQELGKRARSALRAGLSKGVSGLGFIGLKVYGFMVSGFREGFMQGILWKPI